MNVNGQKSVFITSIEVFMSCAKLTLSGLLVVKMLLSSVGDSYILKHIVVAQFQVRQYLLKADHYLKSLLM